MAVDPEGPPFSKYLSLIPPDRLNKAPIISINAFSNPDFNSISVSLADMRADQGAGDSLKAGVSPNDELPPPEEKYADYYDPATLNEAPFISMYGEASGLSFDQHAVCIVQTTVPTSIPTARELLGDAPPDPKLYEIRYQGRLNMAPQVSVNFGTCNDDSTVNVDYNFQPLPMTAASEILSKYRS